MITPLNDWQPKPEEVHLPSGKVALLKRPDLVDLIAGDGEIPDLLSNLVMSMTAGAGGARELSMNKLSKDELKQLLKSLNVIAIACFVEPRLCEGNERQGDAIPVGWLGFEDKAHIMAWALGGRYEAVKSFPEKQNGNLPTVSPGKRIRRPAK